MKMKGILKKTKAGWFVWYQTMRDEITSGYDSIPLHPDNEESLIGTVAQIMEWDGKEVEFEIVMDEPAHRYSHTPYAKIINEGVNEGVKKLSFTERCRIGNYTPFNIENLMGELSKMKKEPYITQEEFEEFHHTIMDGLNIPREMLEK